MRLLALRRKTHKANSSVKNKIWIALLIVVSILTIDQIIKIYVKTHFDPYESTSIFGDWFQLKFIENQGMAFGTTFFGGSMWGKLSLSLFRVVAICGIAYYWVQQLKRGAKMEFLIAIALIFSGATGNLIDSMFYDFIFPFDPCMEFNHLHGSGNVVNCDTLGVQEVRHTGFLFGNVVDMFSFEATWPQWVPWLGGDAIFPAIWNFADASISIGVALVFFRHRSYFMKKNEENPIPETSTSSPEPNKSESEGETT